MKITAFAAIAAAALLGGCATYYDLSSEISEKLYTRSVDAPNAPVRITVTSELIDEETIDYPVTFRNTGTQIISFDYTIADVAGVPHIDYQGANSGLIENLYPGQEVELDNPWNQMNVHVSFGKVVFGKKTSEGLDKIYDRPTVAVDDSLDF
ncbi:MAG: hypothetical protein AAF555_06360 [Verrucomicrobiota bacterium]